MNLKLSPLTSIEYALPIPSPAPVTTRRETRYTYSLHMHCFGKAKKDLVEKRPLCAVKYILL